MAYFITRIINSKRRFLILTSVSLLLIFITMKNYGYWDQKGKTLNLLRTLNSKSNFETDRLATTKIVQGDLKTTKHESVLKASKGKSLHVTDSIGDTFSNSNTKQSIRNTSFVNGKNEEQLRHRIDLKIPHIIHQTWKTNLVPKSMMENVKSWHKMQPSWKYMFWNDEDILRFVKIRYPHFLPTFTGYEMAIMKADVFRYLVLNDIGGLYADLDFESLNPIDGFTSKYSCIISQEPLEHAHLLYDKDQFCSNAIMAAAPGHPFFKWLIGELPKIAKNIPKNDVQRKTGPAMLQQAVNNYTGLFLRGRNNSGHEIYIASQQELMPQFDVKQMSAFYSKCSQKQKYTGVKRNICDEFGKSDFRNRPLGNAYSNHHWIHFWGPTFSAGYGNAVDIDTIAPYRVNVSDYVLKMSSRKT